MIRLPFVYIYHRKLFKKNPHGWHMSQFDRLVVKEKKKKKKKKKKKIHTHKRMAVILKNYLIFPMINLSVDKRQFICDKLHFLPC